MMNNDMRRPRRANVMLTVFAAVMLAPLQRAHADVSIFTPVVQLDQSDDTSFCRITNTDTSGHFVDVVERDGWGGSSTAASDLPVGPGDTVEVQIDSTLQPFCEVVAESTTVADKLLVSLVAQHDSGTTYGAVPGVRALTGSGTVQRTPSLKAASANRFGCWAVNVGASSQSVTITIRDDDGGSLASATATLASGEGNRVLTSSGVVDGRCEASASTNSAVKNLRVSFYEHVSGGFSGNSLTTFTGTLP